MKPGRGVGGLEVRRNAGWDTDVLGEYTAVL